MISYSLVAVIALAALLFGSVEAWALAIVGTLATALFAYSVFAGSEAFGLKSSRPFLIAAFAVMAVPLIQLVPMPADVVGLLSPEAAALKNIAAGASGFINLSLNPYATINEAARLAVYLMLFLVALLAMKPGEGTEQAVRALVVFGFALAVFALIQKATGTNAIYWFRVPAHSDYHVGPFVSRNHYAGFIEMIIPFGLAFGIMASERAKKALWFFFSVIMAVSLFFSLSRGGMTSFVSGLFAFGLVMAGISGKARRLVPLIFFAVAVICYLLFLGLGPLIDRFEQSGVTDMARFSTWEAAVGIFTDFPVFGSGLGTFQYIYPRYQPLTTPGFWDHAHNDYIELLVETGITGIAAAAFFLYLVIRNILTSTGRNLHPALRSAFCASIVSLAVHSTMDFNLHIPSNAMLFFVVLGLGAGMKGRECSRSDAQRQKLKRSEKEDLLLNNEVKQP